MVLVPVTCPYGQSNQVIKGGKTETGQPRYRCQQTDCSHRSVGLEPASNRRLSKLGRGWGKKAPSRMDTEFLDWALADFSGYAAADELDDGPFCMLSAVDHRCYKRILYEGLDHDPDHDDIRAFLGRLKTALDTRDLKRLRITTDGSLLYPEPLAKLARHTKFEQFQQVVDALIIYRVGLLGCGEVCFPEFAEDFDPCQVGSKSCRL